MTRDEATDILQQIADRLHAVMQQAAAALPEPEFDEGEVFNAVITSPDFNQLSPAIRIIMKIEPLVSFCESQILPIINSTPESELKQFKTRGSKDKASNVRN